MSAPPPLPPLPPKPAGGGSQHPYEYDTFSSPYASGPSYATNGYASGSSYNYATNGPPGGPPPVPPLPPQILQQEQRYLTPSPYEFADEASLARTGTPMIAPRAQRVDRSIPHEMARSLDEQIAAQSKTQPPPINYTNPGFSPFPYPGQSAPQSQPPPPQQQPPLPQQQQYFSPPPPQSQPVQQQYQSPPPPIQQQTVYQSPPPPVQQQQQAPAYQQQQQYQSPPPQNIAAVTQSFSHMSMAPVPSSSTAPIAVASPGSAPTTAPPQPATGEAQTSPLPPLSHLIGAAPLISDPNHPNEPHLQVAWCRDVIFLVERAVLSLEPEMLGNEDGGAPGAGAKDPLAPKSGAGLKGNGRGSDPPIGAVPLHAISQDLRDLVPIVVPLILRLAACVPVPPQGVDHAQQQQHGRQKLEPWAAEVMYLRAMLAYTGAFPAWVKRDPRTAFRDFETSARSGYAPAWFRLGRDYENFKDDERARGCFERGAKHGDPGCLYRMGMAHLLGQLALTASPHLALPLLQRAAATASLTVPQPAYVYALILLSEFDAAGPPIPTQLLLSLKAHNGAPLIPRGTTREAEARKYLEAAAYFHFPAAQYKLGHCFEFAEPSGVFVFDPLKSVQWYALASENGEAEADMALSKWFLCGSSPQGQPSASGGGFEKDEALALTFAQKAAKRGLPSAEFAMGYYAEVGVGQQRDVARAIGWYEAALAHGSPDAGSRLAALKPSAPSASAAPLSRQDHDNLTQTTLGRRRTQAMQRSAAQPGGRQQANPAPGQAQHGRKVIENLRKQSLMSPPGVPAVPVIPDAHRPSHGHSNSISNQSYDTQIGFTGSLGAPSSGVGGRMPGLGPHPAAHPYQSSGQQTPPRRSDSPGGYQNVSPPRPTSVAGPSGPGAGAGLSRLERMRLAAQEAPPPVSTPPAAAKPATALPSNGPRPQPPSGASARPTATAASARPNAASPPASGGGKKPQTFAEMGFHGAKADDKDCVIM